MINAFHKGKHHCCILMHVSTGSDRIINAEFSQQEFCGERGSESVYSLSDFMFLSLTDFIILHNVK